MLEWIVAGVGLIVILIAFGLLAVRALEGPGRPPDLSLAAHEVRPSPTGWVVEVEVRNAGDMTAAGVQIEGRLGADASTAELDYVPAHGHARASLRFDADPRRDLELKVLGWREP